MTTQTWDVIGVGENSIDDVYRIAGVIAPDAKLPVSDHKRLPGGQVATTACTCAALGLRTAYVGAFGNDENGWRIRDELTRRGVDVSLAPVREAPNRYAVILVDERSGSRTVLWDRSPALALRDREVPSEAISRARLLHVDDVDLQASVRAAHVARSFGIPVTTDVDLVTDRTRELLEAATIPILAEHVPAALTGEQDPERALRLLRQRHAGMLCVTLGIRGAMLLDGSDLHHAPAFNVVTVDTTGAGDVFRGAFIYALLRGDAPPEILRFANAAAAASCMREGAIGGVPTLEQVNRVLATKRL